MAGLTNGEAGLAFRRPVLVRCPASVDPLVIREHFRDGQSGRPGRRIELRLEISGRSDLLLSAVPSDRRDGLARQGADQLGRLTVRGPNGAKWEDEPGRLRSFIFSCVM